jgi:hypothetical protein
MVRAKFRLVSMTKDLNSEGGGVKFQAVHGNDNRTWSKWTPSGELTMYVSNPAAFEQLKLGDYYFLDFSPAPATEAEEKK